MPKSQETEYYKMIKFTNHMPRYRFSELLYFTMEMKKYD